MNNLQAAGARHEHSTLTASGGVSVTSNSTINTMGAWTELIASTSFDYAEIMVTMERPSINENYMVDLAVGAASSEEIIMLNMCFDTYRGDEAITYLKLPINIPAGTRISARTQTLVAGSRNVRVSVKGLGAGFGSPVGYAGMTIYGVSQPGTVQQVVDPGSTINTYGAWQAITGGGNVLKDIKAIIVQGGDNRNADVSSNTGKFQIAVGTATNEVVIVDGIQCALDNSEVHNHLTGTFFPCTIPEGSRISMRVSCNITDATDRLRTFSIIGLH